MFNSNDKLDDMDYVELDGEDIKSEIAIAEVVPNRANESYFFTGYIKDTMVYGAKTVGGCFAAVVVAPRLLPFVLSYAVPVSSTSIVMVNTATASVSVVSFGMGSKVATKMAESAWDLTSLGLSSAINYMFQPRHSPRKYTAQEVKSESKGPESLKLI
jgi:hypothetical protein